MQFQGYIYTPVPFLYIYGRYTLHFFGNDSSPISPNVRPSVRPKVTNLDITSFVQYNRTSLLVLLWRVVFRNRTAWRCVTAQLTSYWLLLSSHCL